MVSGEGKWQMVKKITRYNIARNGKSDLCHAITPRVFFLSDVGYNSSYYTHCKSQDNSTLKETDKGKIINYS